MVDYDLIIVGSGPAGMNACLYATRSNLKTLVIERDYPGGKIVKANKIENWLGVESVEGSDLALQMFKHAFSQGGVYEQGNVLDIVDLGESKEVVLKDKRYRCYAVIVCVGTSERKMGIPKEDKFYGKGVSYCPVCDGALYKNKTMVVIGNSDHAVEETLYLSKFSKNIILINDKKELNIEKSLLNMLNSNENVKLKNNSKLLSINGEIYVTSVTIIDADNKKIEIETSVVFPLIGSAPDTMFASRLKIVDEKNYIKVNEKQETIIKGIYAAGDCTNKPLKQIVTASSDGAVAAMEAYRYINKISKK